MRTLEPCEKPELILSFDFDGTLHDPASEPPVPTEFFEMIRKLRETRNAVWGINTGRSMPQVLEGMIESHFPFLPDWVVAREREIYFPNAVGRFAGFEKWNKRCEKEIHRLFKRSKKALKEIRQLVGEHTGARYVEIEGEPAGLVSRTEEEMAWILEKIGPIVEAVPDLGWQRNSIYLRFGHKNFQKGSTLAEVSRLYDLSKDRVLAMGDSHNDVEMLSEEFSGTAACPANAVDDVRKLIEARENAWVTKESHGEGVVEALRTLLEG